MRLSKKRFLELVVRTRLRVSDIAASIGCSRSHLSNVIAGRKALGLKYAKRLMEMFGADRLQFALDWDAMGIKVPLKAAR